MLNAPFYHGHVRKLISAFGQLFSDIKIATVDGSGTIRKVNTVPIRYAGTDKTLLMDPPEKKPYLEIFPRMSFEVTNLGYDPEKKLNPLNQIKGVDSPTPYNVDFSLYILSRNQSDALQILEQIIPYFNPTLTVSMENSPIEGMRQDVPITFTGSSLADDYEGGEETNRRVEWSLNFTAQLSFFKNVEGQYENELIKFIEKNYDPSDPTSCSPPVKRILKKGNRIEKIIINEYPDTFDTPQEYSSSSSIGEPSFITDVFLTPQETKTSKSTQSKYIVHHQTQAASTWSVNHFAGKLPVVVVYDPNGYIIEAQVRSINSNNTIEISFNEETYGTAVLSW